jgi:5-formyltetrahydrofolate cyclo-ligase
VSTSGAPSTPAKAALRATLLAARRARSESDLLSARAAIAAQALELAGSLRCVAAYQPLRTEPGSLQLLDGLAGLGVTVLLPVLEPDRDLSWVVRGTDEARPLADAQLVFAPALAVDRRGNRLGRGGGSYDRALARLAPGTPVVALVFEDEVLAAVPVDPWDRPVTGALTPGGRVAVSAVGQPE